MEYYNLDLEASSIVDLSLALCELGNARSQMACDSAVRVCQGRTAWRHRSVIGMLLLLSAASPKMLLI